MSANSVYQTDTFAVIGNGATVDTSHAPLQAFSIEVTATGGTPTLWDVIIEGSISGTNFSTILRHTSSLGLNTVLFTGSNATPCRHFRVRVAALTLGLAASITTHVIGMQ